MHSFKFSTKNIVVPEIKRIFVFLPNLITFSSLSFYVDAVMFGCNKYYNSLTLKDFTEKSVNFCHVSHFDFCFLYTSDFFLFVYGY